MQVAKRVGFVSVSVLGLVLSAACGGGSSNSSATTQTEDAYCQARESRITACAGDSGVSVGSFDRNDFRRGCGRDYRCAVAVAANPDAYFSCRSNTNCARDTESDDCLSQSARGIVRPESDVCAKKYASCKAAKEKTFDDDTCAGLNAMRDDVVGKVVACLDRPCGEIEDCVEATLEAISPDC